MSQCPDYQAPLRSRRRLMRLALEDEYGVPPGTVPPFGVYEELFPLQPSWNTASREEDGQLVGDVVVLDAGYGITGQCPLRFFDGTLPDWTRVLELAGCPQDLTGESWGRIVFAPGRPRSATVDVVYGATLRRATGVRSTLAVRAEEVGGPLRCEFTMKGAYSLPVADENAFALPAPSLPPTFLNIDFGIVNERTGITLTPVVKSMGIEFGAELRTRDDDRGDHDAVETELQPLRTPLWETVVEARDDVDWDSQFRARDRFALYLTMYDTSSKRMMVCTPLGYTAKLNAVPTFGDVNGVTVQTLQFRLTGQRFIEVELF